MLTTARCSLSLLAPSLKRSLWKTDVIPIILNLLMPCRLTFVLARMRVRYYSSSARPWFYLHSGILRWLFWEMKAFQQGADKADLLYTLTHIETAPATETSVFCETRTPNRISLRFKDGCCISSTFTF